MGKLHCLDVGCGDASLIVADSATFQVDCHQISDHADLLPSNKLIHGVFITHQHYDHYSGLEYLRDNGYKIKFLIYSPYDRRHGDNSVTADEWREFSGHRDYFESKGTKIYSPFKQSSFDEPYK